LEAGLSRHLLVRLPNSDQSKKRNAETIEVIRRVNSEMLFAQFVPALNYPLGAGSAYHCVSSGVQVATGDS